MDIVGFFNRNKKDIVIILITVFITWYFSKIGFEDWRRKVAKEAIENIKLEQSFCDRAILTVNEKIDRFKNNGEKSKDKVILEYFDNIKNQITSLKDIINRSKLTWANIFPDEAREAEKFDKQLIVSIRGIKSLENDIKLFMGQREAAILDKNNLAEQNKKIQITINKLDEKINDIKNRINNFQSTNLIYPSNFLSANENIILPNGNTFSLDNISIDPLSPLFQQGVSINSLPLNNFQSVNLDDLAHCLSSDENINLPNSNAFNLDNISTNYLIALPQRSVPQEGNAIFNSDGKVTNQPILSGQGYFPMANQEPYREETYLDGNALKRYERKK